MTDKWSKEQVDVSFELMRLTTQLNDAYERERRTRMDLLRLHALMGIFVGAAMVILGSPANLENEVGEWVRGALGGLAIVAGLVLLYGLRRPRNHLTFEVVGLALMGLWDLAMVIAIALIVVDYDGHWSAVLPFSPHELPADQPRPYALVVYVVLTAMVWGVHLRAVLRDRRQGRGRV